MLLRLRCAITSSRARPSTAARMPSYWPHWNCACAFFFFHNCFSFSLHAPLQGHVTFIPKWQRATGMLPRKRKVS